MNIFFLDTDPMKAAQMQCDKHVVKMVLESAQLLCTAHHLLGSCDPRPSNFYQATHKKHPCQLWIQKCPANYCWLGCHALALAEEYNYRYNKRHKSQDIIEWCIDNHPNHPIPWLSSDQQQFGTWFITPPPQAVPEEYKNPDFVLAYRDYYWYNKRSKMTMCWTKREKPDWWKERANELHVCK